MSIMCQRSKAHGRDNDRGPPAHRFLDEASRGRSELPAARRYIAALTKHRRRVSYDEHGVAYDEHGVAYDARYLWD